MYFSLLCSAWLYLIFCFLIRRILISESFFPHSPCFQSRPFLKDRRKFVQLVDPRLEGQFPLRCLHHAIAITAMCLQEQPTYRPIIGDIVVALEYLHSQSNVTEVRNGGVCRQTPQSPSHLDKYLSEESNTRLSSTSA